MKIFGFEITIKKSLDSCQHQFDGASVMNWTKEPKCFKCLKPLSLFINKKFTVQEVHHKLCEAGYGNQFCLNVIEALSK